MTLALMSIKPPYVQAILDGRKRFELRRRRPRMKPGSMIVLYSTTPERKVRGVAMVGRVLTAPVPDLWELVSNQAAIDPGSFDEYFQDCPIGHAVELSAVWPVEWEITLDDLREAAPGYFPPQFLHYVSDGHPLYPLLTAADPLSTMLESQTPGLSLGSVTTTEKAS